MANRDDRSGAEDMLKAWAAFSAVSFLAPTETIDDLVKWPVRAANNLMIAAILIVVGIPLAIATGIYHESAWVVGLGRHGYFTRRAEADTLASRVGDIIHHPENHDSPMGAELVAFPHNGTDKVLVGDECKTCTSGGISGGGLFDGLYVTYSNFFDSDKPYAWMLRRSEEMNFYLYRKGQAEFYLEEAILRAKAGWPVAQSAEDKAPEGDVRLPGIASYRITFISPTTVPPVDHLYGDRLNPEEDIKKELTYGMCLESECAQDEGFSRPTFYSDSFYWVPTLSSTQQHVVDEFHKVETLAYWEQAYRMNGITDEARVQADWDVVQEALSRVRLAR